MLAQVQASLQKFEWRSSDSQSHWHTYCVAMIGLSDVLHGHPSEYLAAAHALACALADTFWTAAPNPGNAMECTNLFLAGLLA